jgi:hypothetical protein
MGGVEPFQVCYIFWFGKKYDIFQQMSDAGVHTLFQKDTCKMVRGAMVLMKGVHIGTLYKLLGNVDSTGCNNIVVPEVDSTSTQLNSTWVELINTNHSIFFIKSTRPCYGTRGWDTLEKKDFELCTTKVWSKVFLDCNLEVIFVNIAYMENKIRLGSHLELQGKKGF